MVDGRPLRRNGQVPQAVIKASVRYEIARSTDYGKDSSRLDQDDSMVD